MSDPATRAYNVLRISFPWLPEPETVSAVAVHIRPGEPPYADIRTAVGDTRQGGFWDKRRDLRSPGYDSGETPVYDRLMAEAKRGGIRQGRVRAPRKVIEDWSNLGKDVL